MAFYCMLCAGILLLCTELVVLRLFASKTRRDDRIHFCVFESGVMRFIKYFKSIVTLLHCPVKARLLVFFSLLFVENQTPYYKRFFS